MFLNQNGPLSLKRNGALDKKLLMTTKRKKSFFSFLYKFIMLLTIKYKEEAFVASLVFRNTKRK